MRNYYECKLPKHTSYCYTNKTTREPTTNFGKDAIYLKVEI